MDLILKGVKMPERCTGCKMSNGCCGVRCQISTETVGGLEIWKLCPDEGRPDWCPASALPEGHGPIIDAKVFLKRLDEYAENQFGCKTDAESVIEAQSSGRLTNNEQYVLEGLYEARELLEELLNDKATIIIEEEQKWENTMTSRNSRSEIGTSSTTIQDVRRPGAS